jgi:hypothetical protein
MYLGVNVLQMISQPDIITIKDMLAVFHDRCRQFLIEGCRQIKKLTKTKVRNKLQVPALNGLLLSSELMKRISCVNFQPTKSMIDSMNVTIYNKPTDVIEEENLVTDA